MQHPDPLHRSPSLSVPTGDREAHSVWRFCSNPSSFQHRRFPRTQITCRWYLDLFPLKILTQDEVSGKRLADWLLLHKIEELFLPKDGKVGENSFSCHGLILTWKNSHLSPFCVDGETGVPGEAWWNQARADESLSLIRFLHRNHDWNQLPHLIRDCSCLGSELWRASWLIPLASWYLTEVYRSRGTNRHQISPA